MPSNGAHLFPQAETAGIVSHEMPKGFVDALNHFIDYVQAGNLVISRVVIEVTEKYVRRRLKLDKDAPLVYRGMKLICIGSKRHREFMEKQNDAR